MPADVNILEKPLILNLFHKSFRGNVKIGEAVVDLNMLLVVNNIDGWYHAVGNGKEVGQIKVKISCDDNTYTKFTGKVKQDVFNRLPSPQIIEKTIFVKEKVENKFEERLKIYGQSLENAEDDDIIARHYDNMKAIESLSKNLELRLSGNLNNSSPLRKSKENSPFRRFVPAEAYQEKSSLRSSYQEKSPTRNSYPLKKSRENSPPNNFSGITHSSVIRSSIKNTEENPSLNEGYRYKEKFIKSRENSPQKNFETKVFEYPSFIHKPSKEFLHKPEDFIHELPAKPVSNYDHFSYKEKPDHFSVSNMIANDYKEEFPNLERKDEDDWDSDKIADVLKTIEEASKYGENEHKYSDYEEKPVAINEYYQEPEYSQYKNPYQEEKLEKYENEPVYSKNFDSGKHNYSSPIFEENTPSFEVPSENNSDKSEKFNKRRSPKVSRVALPKSLLSDPEISRIAAIMKGSK